MNAYNKKDLSTLSNYCDVVIKNVHLDWNLDFATQKISGSVTHTIEVLTDNTTEVALDTSKIQVVRVSINNSPVSFYFKESNPILGRCLRIVIPSDLRSKSTVFDLKVQYSTSPNASAIQWLSPKATSSGKQPFVFTQCQAIHARSLFPCQDTPGVKAPYSATVRAPTWCVVLMSALQQTCDNSGVGTGIFHWKQPVPTPSYLVALAAGELEGRVISNRVTVWGEPSVVDAAAHEFAETEQFLQAAESLTLPYAWTKYDVLCLPPSFPYGGMENPCLTFATPTLLAGDRSLADVIAHEIAHSWTGNLVTNSTWEHFWLNEGWTVWLERKIMARVKGKESVFKLSAEIGWAHLETDIDRMGSDSRFSSLVWELGLEDPDEAFSSVPYEKGFNFLYYLESVVSTPLFEAFAKAYLEKFKYKTLCSGEFKDFFLEYFKDNKAIEVIDWNKHFYTRGMPFIKADFSNSLSETAVYLSSKWIEWIEKGGNPWGVGPADIQGWSSHQTNIFLERLVKYSGTVQPIPLSILEALDASYHFTESKNSEIRFSWQILCLRSEASWIVPHVVKFIISQGRMKYVRPLYRALNKSAVGSGIARQTFIEHNEIYHPIARKMIAADIGVDLSAPKIAPVVPHVVDAKPSKVESTHSGSASNATTSKAAPQEFPAEESSSWFSSTVVLTAIAVATIATAYYLRSKR